LPGSEFVDVDLPFPPFPPFPPHPVAAAPTSAIPAITVATVRTATPVLLAQARLVSKIISNGDAGQRHLSGGGHGPEVPGGTGPPLLSSDGCQDDVGSVMMSSDPVHDALQVSRRCAAGTRRERIRRWVRTWSVEPAELDSAEIVAESEARGDAHLCGCGDGEQVRLLGRVVATTLFPVGSPTSSITLDDGTGLVDVTFSAGPEPPPQVRLGAKLEIVGQLRVTGPRPVLIDPAVVALPE
jgi:hypothetical protein